MTTEEADFLEQSMHLKFNHVYSLSIARVESLLQSLHQSATQRSIAHLCCW